MWGFFVGKGTRGDSRETRRNPFSPPTLQSLEWNWGCQDFQLSQPLQRLYL